MRVDAGQRRALRLAGGRAGIRHRQTGEFQQVGQRLFHALHELWDVTKPGGILLLAVPAWARDAIMFESARVYGPLRLPLLVQQVGVPRF